MSVFITVVFAALIMKASVEHAAVGFYSLGDLAQMKLPSGYRTDIELWTRSR